LLKFPPPSALKVVEKTLFPPISTDFLIQTKEAFAQISTTFSPQGGGKNVISTNFDRLFELIKNPSD